MLFREEIVRTFYVKELQKTYQREFSDEKVIKKKSDTLYVKWNIFHNQILLEEM